MNVDPNPMNLDSASANKLFAEGAVLVIAGIPLGTQFGIDLCSYTIGENFRGVKMIPAGIHFVWCASQGQYGDVAPRVGFVYHFKRNEIVVREWDNNNEELRERQISDPQLEKSQICDNLHILEKFLAPYDYRYIGEWNKLIDTVSEEIIERCRPELGTIRTNMELQSCPDSERPRGVQNTASLSNKKIVLDENELLPDLKPLDGTAPRFTNLPERIPKGSVPTDISRHSMDCIEAVDKLLGAFKNHMVLIEEIQLSYAFFIVGHSVESLAHWRKILNLLSHSETAVQKYKLFYMKYSEVLIYQLPLLPEELMECTERNTVWKDVRLLLINLNTGGLSKNADRLSNKLMNSMNWNFDGLLEDDPDELPTVVDTT